MISRDELCSLINNETELNLEISFQRYQILSRI